MSAGASVRADLMTGVIVECPVCNDPMFSAAPCPRCVAMGERFEAKRKADEQRMAFLRRLPGRTDVGIVPHERTVAPARIPAAPFLCILVSGLMVSAWVGWLGFWL